MTPRLQLEPFANVVQGLVAIENGPPEMEAEILFNVAPVLLVNVRVLVRLLPMMVGEKTKFPDKSSVPVPDNVMEEGLEFVINPLL